MADTTEFTGTQQAQQGTGLIPQAGQFLSNVQQIANQPSVQRSLPAVIAVVVLVALVVMTCWTCCKALCDDDEEYDVYEEDTKKTQ